MHDQLISSLVLRRQRQIYRIIVARPTNLYAFYRAPIKPNARESILRASVIGGRYDADEIAAIIGDHESRRARGIIGTIARTNTSRSAESFFRK